MRVVVTSVFLMICTLSPASSGDIASSFIDDRLIFHLLFDLHREMKGVVAEKDFEDDGNGKDYFLLFYIFYVHISTVYVYNKILENNHVMF